MFPTPRRAPMLRRLFWIIALQGYHPRFLVRTLLPLIPARTRSNRWLPRVHTMCPLPLPPRRSRERPRRHRLPRGDLTVCRPPPPQRLCREHMPRPLLRPRARTMYPLPLPPRRSRERLRRPRLPRRDLTVCLPPPPQRLCREHMPLPLLLPSGHTTCPRRLPRGQDRGLHHSLQRRQDPITRFPMQALPRRQRTCRSRRRLAQTFRLPMPVGLQPFRAYLPSFPPMIFPASIRAPRLARVPCPSQEQVSHRSISLME